MKTINALFIFFALVAASCSSSSYVTDDVYYSRNGSSQNSNEKIASSPSAAYTTDEVSQSYEYEAYYSDEVAAPVANGSAEPVYSTSETVVEPDGSTYTTTETYYDSEYASRFRRFGNNSSSGFNYYDGYNSGCFDCSPSSNFYVGFGAPYYGWSAGYGYGWPHYNRWPYYSYSPYWGYDPFFYNPWQYNYGWGWGGSYWAGYNHGYWNGYNDGYYGYPEYSGGRRNHYGHRGSLAGGTLVPSGNNSRGFKSGENNNNPAQARGANSVGNQTQSAASRGERPTREEAVIQRGNNVNTPTSVRQERPSVEKPTRLEKPANSRDANVMPAATDRNRQSRPSADQKVNEYRKRYNKPQGTSTSPTRDQTKTYSPPSERQPKSSNEYVRPQSNQPVRNSNTPANNRPVLRNENSSSQPASRPAVKQSEGQQRSSGNVSTPARRSSSGSGSVSTPSRSSSSGSVGTSSPSRSSSSGSSSSGSSSSGSSSRGGRK